VSFKKCINFALCTRVYTPCRLYGRRYVVSECPLVVVVVSASVAAAAVAVSDVFVAAVAVPVVVAIVIAVVVVPFLPVVVLVGAAAPCDQIGS
jgi:hypothetical protein